MVSNFGQSADSTGCRWPQHKTEVLVFFGCLLRGSTFFSIIWLACWADRRPNTNHLHSWAPNLLIGTRYKPGIMVAHNCVGGVSHLQSHPCSLAPAVGLRAHCFSQEQKWNSSPAWHWGGRGVVHIDWISLEKIWKDAILGEIWLSYFLL